MRRTRLQIYVLLAHRRAVRHHGQGVRRDAWRAVLDVEGDRDAVGAGQPQRADAAHRHPAVGDLGALEDAPESAKSACTV